MSDHKSSADGRERQQAPSAYVAANNDAGLAVPTVRALPVPSAAGDDSLLLGLTAPDVGTAEVVVPADQIAALELAGASGSRYWMREAVRELLWNCALDAARGRPSRPVLKQAALLGWAVADQVHILAEELVHGRVGQRGITVAGARVHRSASAGCGSGRRWPAWRRYREPKASQ